MTREHSSFSPISLPKLRLPPTNKIVINFNFDKIAIKLTSFVKMSRPYDQNEFICIENNNKQTSKLTSFDNDFNTKIEMKIVESVIEIVENMK